MSGILIALMISVIVFIIGIIILYNSKRWSEGELLGQIMLFIGGVTSGTLLMASLLGNFKTSCEYLEPVTVTKTTDGFTVVSYKNPELQSITSDKGNVYLADNTNLVVEITNKFNAWNILGSSTHTITMRK